VVRVRTTAHVNTAADPTAPPTHAVSRDLRHLKHRQRQSAPSGIVGRPGGDGRSAGPGRARSGV